MEWIWNCYDIWYGAPCGNDEQLLPDLSQRSLSWMSRQSPPPEHTGLDDKAFQLSASPFLKVHSKQHYFLMSCLVLFSFISLYLFIIAFFENKQMIDWLINQYLWKLTFFSGLNFLWKGVYPVHTGRKLNVHETFRRCPGRLLNVLCTFNLCPMSTG